MPLAHAILGFLEYQPMTGYDLKKYFDLSIAHFWSATQSHIYKALEKLEKDGLVESTVIPQEGKPSKKQYQITDSGRLELQNWVAAPLPVAAPREAWLIQVFFAHGITNDQLVSLFEKRIEQLREYHSQLKIAQSTIEENYEQVRIDRLRDLWQLTVDYGAEYYGHEIAWLERTLPRLRKLPAFESPNP